MKTKGVRRRRRTARRVRHQLLGLMALIVASAGCATSKPPLRVSQPEPSFAMLQVEPGPVALTSSLQPGSFEFEASRGRIESAGEGAAVAARAVLTTPNLHHAQLEAAVGAVEFVVAPFAAGYAALAAKHRVLPADKLAETSQELSQEMRAMAGQERLRKLLLEHAGEQTHRRLVSMEPGEVAGAMSAPVSAVVDTTVESLQLRRAGASSDRYTLRMTARARVIRAADRAVIFNRHYEFQSESAMFIDWARPGGFESVAQTGYRDLAERMAKDVFAAPTGEPLQLGPAVAASTASERAAVPGRLKFARAGFRPHDVDGQTAPDLGAARVEFAAFRVADNDSLEIYSPGAMSDLAIEGPPAKEETAGEGSTETEWLLGGLENDRNAMVQAAACLAAVPLGLWEQTVGLLHSRTSEEMESAERNLKAVARRIQAEQVLADEMAQALTPQTSESIVLVKGPFRVHEDNGPALLSCASPVTLSGSSDLETLPVSLTKGGPGTGAEIQLVDARLARMPGVRKRLALVLDAQVTFVRKSDGQELYTFPVSYRGAGKPLKAWAAGDAEVFRKELRNCCREMGTAAAQQLVACGLVAPRPEHTPILAQQ